MTAPASTDHLVWLYEQVRPLGLDDRVLEVFSGTTEAGVLHGPLVEAFDVTAQQLAVVERVLSVARELHAYDEWEWVFKAAKRVRTAAGLAALVMPPVRTDSEGRYGVRPDAEGLFPPVGLGSWLTSIAATRVEAYRDELAAGEWVDPNALAGAVADLHDAARMWVVLMAHEELCRDGDDEWPSHPAITGD